MPSNGCLKHREFLPTPAEIEARCAKIRAENLERKRNKDDPMARERLGNIRVMTVTILRP